MVTTMVSFILILISFNLICSSYIKKDSVEALNAAVTMAETVGIRISSAKSLTPSELPTGVANSDEYRETTGSVEGALAIEESSKVAAALQKEFIDEGNGIKIMIANNGEAIYPAKIETLATTATNVPTRILLDDSSYYAMAAPIMGQATAVFYKDIQPLEDLVTDVNAALFLLLIICGIITVVASMALSSGMVRSIRQLCNFTEDIGMGNFTERTFHLKEQELAVLGHNMNQMAKQLSEYDEEKKVFFQNVSHELRTPLMSIQGYAEGIIAGVFKEEKTNEAAEVILCEGERLAEMVEDLLYLSRIDSSKGKENQASFHCEEVIDSVIDRVRAVAFGKNIELKVLNIDCHKLADTVPPEKTEFVIQGNRSEFEKALLNIIINGIRHAASRVEIACNCQNRTITVTDDGEGIQEKDLPHIFKRFYKGKGGSTGIGLSISSVAMEKIGGYITAENVKDDKHGVTGAVFTINL